MSSWTNHRYLQVAGGWSCAFCSILSLTTDEAASTWSSVGVKWLPTALWQSTKGLRRLRWSGCGSSKGSSWTGHKTQSFCKCQRMCKGSSWMSISQKTFGESCCTERGRAADTALGTADSSGAGCSKCFNQELGPYRTTKCSQREYFPTSYSLPPK